MICNIYTTYCLFVKFCDIMKSVASSQASGRVKFTHCCHAPLELKQHQEIIGDFISAVQITMHEVWKLLLLSILYSFISVVHLMNLFSVI